MSSIGKVKSSGSKSLVSSSEKTRGMMKEKNGKFRSIFDNSDECYIYLSRFGRIQEVNKKAVEIFGGPEEELIGKHFTRVGLFSAKEAFLLMSNFRKILSGKKPFLKVQLTNKKGQRKYLECSAHLVQSGKKILGIMVLGRDVTERTNVEERLREAEREYRNLVDNALVGVFKTTIDGEIIYANEALSKMLGFESAEEMMSESILLFYENEERAKVFVERLKKKGKVTHFEFETIPKLGDEKVFLVNATYDGYVVSGMATDITGLKEAERALAESEERYSAVVENSTDGIVIIQDGVLKFVNSASVELVGSTPDGMIGTNFLEFVAPKSRKIVSKRYADRMAGKEVPNIYEISLLRKDGSFLPVEVNAELIEYEGRPADLVFIRNITERKRYQKELRLSEERYRRIVETAPDGIVTVDKEGNVTSCNKAFAELTGYSKQEVVGKHFSEIPTLQWIDNPGYANILSCVARGKVPKPFEVKWVHKDGTERFAEIRVSVLRMGKSVLVFQAIARDITDRRRAEQAVRESEEKFRSLADHSPNMIFINKMGRIVYANNKCEEILGYKKKELYSQDFDFTRLVAPESEDTVRSSFESCMKGEEVRPYEYTIVTKNGERIEAILAAKLIKYGGTSAILGVVTDITERKRAEEAIRRSEERYRLLAENVADFIWTTDMIGRFTYVSPSIENLLGYSVDEALSAKWKDYMTPESISIVIETLERELATEDTRGKRGHNSVTLELELIRRDGLKVWTETEATFLRNDCGEPMGILGVSRDITDRKHAEEALRKSEERYRLLAENVADVIWTTDMNLRFTYITPSVKHLMGYSVEEATALGFEDFIVPSSLEKAMNALRRRISAKNVEENSYGGVTLDLEFARKDGSTVWTQTEITFLSNEDGQPIGLLGATRDITEHKRIVSDLERANEELRATQANLIQSEKMASIGTLASGIAHEINNPLATITGYAEAILDEEDPVLMKKHASRILSAAGRASDVVRWLSKHSRQAKDLNIVDVQLNEVLKDSLESMKLARSSLNIEVRTDFSEIPVIRGNRNELQQIFVNLLNNSADAMPNGGRIVLSTKVRGKLVEVSVSDTGVGIPKEHLNKVFDPFFTTKEVGEGTGLGLYVVSMIVKRHHGTIDVESVVGKGSTFTLRFPTADCV